jgi:hypothetical protein
MLGKLHAFVGRIATWAAVALLFIGFVACTLGFIARMERLGNNPPVLDGRSWYTPAEVQALFDKLGPAGRSDYALTEVTLDVAFPFIYGGILLILIYRLFEPKPARILLLLPLIGAICDLLENASIASMAWTYTGSPPGFASIATFFTLAKNLLVGLAVVVVLVGAIRALILRRAGEGEPPGVAVSR